MGWNTSFDIRTRDPLPHIVFVCGFIAFIYGVNLHFIDEDLSLKVLITGILTMFAGMMLWLITRR